MGYTTRRKNNFRKSKKNRRRRGRRGGNAEISTGVTGLNNPMPKILGLEKS